MYLAALLLLSFGCVTHLYGNNTGGQCVSGGVVWLLLPVAASKSFEQQMK